jgi:hypothetical protein
VREIRKHGSVGARGEKSPWATRPFSPASACDSAVAHFDDGGWLARPVIASRTRSTLSRAIRKRCLPFSD